MDYDGVFIGNALDVTEAKAISQRHNNEIHGVFNYHKQKDIDSITGEHALSQPPKEL